MCHEKDLYVVVAVYFNLLYSIDAMLMNLLLMYVSSVCI